MYKRICQENCLCQCHMELSGQRGVPCVGCHDYFRHENSISEEEYREKILEKENKTINRNNLVKQIIAPFLALELTQHEANYIIETIKTRVRLEEAPTKSEETVNHPSHYGGDTTYEAIKVIEAWNLNFNLGNTVKYICRADKKGDRLENLKKALFYLEREIKKIDGRPKEE